MLRNRALLAALDLASAPALTQQARRQQLPDGVLDVIRIVAGCKETLEEAARLTGMDPRYIKVAAELYIHQILMFPTADSYRVLGVRPGASRDEMRTHMRWLMTWLHPDRRQAEWQSAFATRVLSAWREVGRGQTALVEATSTRPRRLAPPPARIPWVPRVVKTRRGHESARPWSAGLAVIILVALVVPSASVEAGLRDSARAALWLMNQLPAVVRALVPRLSGAHDPVAPQRALNE